MAGEILGLAYWAGLLLTALVFALGHWDRPNRRQVRIFGLILILAGTYEFWILGSRSGMTFDAELAVAIPGITGYLSPDGGQFNHSAAGGVDSPAIAAYTGNYLSLNRFVLSYLPLGAASFIHKILVAAFCFWGTYRTARSVARMDRGMSAAAAALYLSSEFVARTTWIYGLGLAFIPVLTYLYVGRLGRRFYWTGVVTGATVYAIIGEPFHDFIACLPTVLAVALIRGWKTPLRVVLPLALTIVLMVLNNAENLFAKVQMGPFTHRGIYFDDKIAQFTELAPRYLIMPLIGLGMAAWGNRALAFRLAVATILLEAGSFIAGSIIFNVPALKVVRSANLEYLTLAVCVPASLVLGMGARVVADKLAAPTGSKLRKASFILVAALAGALFLENRAFNTLVWLVQGGLSTYQSVKEQLAERPWLENQPVRVISSYYRISANMIMSTGLDTFDGTHDLSASRLTKIWQRIITTVPVYNTHPGLFSFAERFNDCGPHDLPTMVDFGLLRMMNVGYVVSMVPMDGVGVTQVRGPSETPPSDLPCSNLPSMERLKRMAKLIWSPPELRIYAIGKPLPRVHAPNTVMVADGDDDTVYALIRAKGPEGAAVVHQQEAPPDGIPDGQVRLGPWRLGRDSVTAEIQGGQGMVIYSSPYLPYWRAYADGKPTAVFPVNGAQMGAIVPHGTSRLEFRYFRPSVASKLGLTQPPW